MRRQPIARCLLAAAAALCLCACRDRGREVFIREGCVDCHRFRGVGGGMAPDLSDVARRMDEAAMRRQITQPGMMNPDSRMPAFPRLSWFDLRSLIAFLRG